jgi:hypothetical protein
MAIFNSKLFVYQAGYLATGCPVAASEKSNIWWQSLCLFNIHLYHPQGFLKIGKRPCFGLTS